MSVYSPQVTGLPSADPANNVHYTIVHDRQIGQHAFVHKEYCINIMDRRFLVSGKHVKTGLVLTMMDGYYSDNIQARKLLSAIGDASNEFNYNWESIDSRQMEKDYRTCWKRLIGFLLHEINIPWIFPYHVSCMVSEYSIEVYNLALLRIGSGSIYRPPKNEHIGLDMYYNGRVPEDFQVFIPEDERWIDWIDKTHTFDVVRRSTWRWVQDCTKDYSEFWENNLKKKEKELELK